jgi:dienelactone hydrolase
MVRHFVVGTVSFTCLCWMASSVCAEKNETEVSVERKTPQEYKLHIGPVPVVDQPFDRFATTDRFGREITFYLSESNVKQGPLPLVVYIQGSGCTSHFIKAQGRVVPAGGHIVVQEVAVDKARVLIVEKPGVKFLDEARTDEEQSGSAEFRQEHTLERWAEAVEAAIRAAGQLQDVRPGKVLVIGHSEGGLVACRVARDLPDLVTHVASLAGGGPSQLFDLITLARKGNFFRSVSDDPEARVGHVLEKWQDIQSNPDSTEKLFFGFAYRRWSSFLSSSPIEELNHVKSKIYLAQGADDNAVDPASCDALFAHLRSKGKDVIYDRIVGANHSFRLKDQPKVDGWQQQMERILNWFLLPD